MSKITAYVTILSDADDPSDPAIGNFLQQARQALPGFEVEISPRRLPRFARDQFTDFKYIAVAKRTFNI